MNEEIDTPKSYIRLFKTDGSDRIGMKYFANERVAVVMVLVVLEDAST